MSVNPEVNEIKNIPNKVVNISMGDKRQLKPTSLFNYTYFKLSSLHILLNMYLMGGEKKHIHCRSDYFKEI